MTEIRPSGSFGYGDIPEIEMTRLKLRAHRLDDLDDLAEMWAAPEVTRFIGGKPRSRADLWQQIQRAIGCWAMLGYGYWVIEDRATGLCVGEIGFMEGLRAIEPAYTGTPEAGWVIAQSYWGKGYANEALAGAFAWRDANVPDRRTVCIIEPDHAVSIHIAEKHGFSKLGETHLGGDPIWIFERKL